MQKQPALWQERLQRFRQILRKAAPFGAGIAAALAAVLLYNWLFPAPRPLTPNQVNEAIAQAMASATPPPAYSVGVYQAIQPSLVLIQSHSAGGAAQGAHALGSGVIIDDRGDILTSLHVVKDAAEIKLTFADGSESSATIAAQQEENDIAVLHAGQVPKNLPPAILGNPNAMQVGDEAYVVGNPFGIYSSMSAGVISGFNRSFESPNSKQKIKGLIQVDAAVNPGNSGGPLLNRHGEVIGIVVGILNPTDQDFFIGIGFAVPINVAGGAAGSPPY